MLNVLGLALQQLCKTDQYFGPTVSTSTSRTYMYALYLANTVYGAQMDTLMWLKADFHEM